MPVVLFWVAEEARRGEDVADLQAVHPVEEDEPVETWQCRYRDGKQGHGKRKRRASSDPDTHPQIGMMMTARRRLQRLQPAAS